MTEREMTAGDRKRLLALTKMLSFDAACSVMEMYDALAARLAAVEGENERLTTYTIEIAEPDHAEVVEAAAKYTEYALEGQIRQWDSLRKVALADGGDYARKALIAERALELKRSVKEAQ